MAHRFYHSSGLGLLMRTLSNVLFTAVLCYAQSSFNPALTPNLPAQVIGHDDLISVSVYGSPELSGLVRVSPAGLIQLPMLKKTIKAEGLLPSQLAEAISAAFRDEQFLVDPSITVTVAEYHSRPISVAGAVKSPLVFQAEANTTLLEALVRAQGLREDAGPEILVSAPGHNSGGDPDSGARRISVRGLFAGADPSLNLKLYGGEEIRVPVGNKVYVVGNVKRPGAFPMATNSDTTILQLLALSEGLMPYSARDAFIIRRSESGARSEIPVQLNKILQRKTADVALMPDDILYVPDSKGKRLGIGAIEKLLLFGSTAGATALVYAR